MKDFMEVLNKQVGGFDLRQIVDPNERVQFIDKANVLRNDLDMYNTYIQEYYNERITISDIIFDRQFIGLYGIKVISFILFYYTVIETEKRVLYDYSMRTNIFQGPPRLIKYPLYVFGIHFVLYSLLFVILFVLYYLYKKNTNTFVIDDYFLRCVIVDYITLVILSLLLSLLSSTVIQKKEYFRYNTEGMRAIRIQSQLMITLYGLFSICPFFYYL